MASHAPPACAVLVQMAFMIRGGLDLDADAFPLHAVPTIDMAS